MLCLCACDGSDRKPKQKLDTPQNLCMKIISNRANFVWNEVLLSDYYTVDINGKQYKVTDACIDILEVGASDSDFVVKVQANCSNSDYLNSEWSTEYKITVGGYSLNLLSDGSGYEVVGGKDATGNLFVLPTYKGTPIVKIGDSAFANNTALTGIILPASVKAIGKRAFANNTALADVIWPDIVEEIGSYAFENDTALMNITLPEYLKNIGGSAFQGCSNLTSLHIPRQVERFITNSIFRKCENLVELTVDPENYYYRSDGNCIIQRSNNRVVAGCAGSVIPNDVDAIASSAFSYVYGLKSITIPYNIKEIDSITFHACKDLEQVVISAGVESVNTNAFMDCGSLKKITVEDGNPIYRDENNCLIHDRTLVLGCAGSIIPSSVTVIGEGAFLKVNLEKLTIPSSVVRLEKNAFASTDLGDIVIPSAVQTIGDYAFHKSKVRSVIIENGVKSIGSYAFGECQNLETVYVPTSVTSIGEYAFVPYSDSYSGGTATVEERTCAPTVCGENVNVDNNVTLRSTSAYYHSENCELEVENNYPYVVAYYIPKTIKSSGLLGSVEQENSAIKYIFDAAREYKAFSPCRMGYTFGGWALERGGTVAITKQNTVDDLETFIGDGEEYVKVYAIWNKND
ncbi:MAG: leucine-rich repeat domain-containing protein [Clostridiales bacterium]|nr:leucine-rich repeat domain-containing protein [Clostridiales bacterium]